MKNFRVENKQTDRRLRTRRMAKYIPYKAETQSAILLGLIESLRF